MLCLMSHVPMPSYVFLCLVVLMHPMTFFLILLLLSIYYCCILLKNNNNLFWWFHVMSSLLSYFTFIIIYISIYLGESITKLVESSRGPGPSYGLRMASRGKSRNRDHIGKVR